MPAGLALLTALLPAAAPAATVTLELHATGGLVANAQVANQQDDSHLCGLSAQADGRQAFLLVFGKPPGATLLDPARPGLVLTLADARSTDARSTGAAQAVGRPAGEGGAALPGSDTIQASIGGHRFLGLGPGDPAFRLSVTLALDGGGGTLRATHLLDEGGAIAIDLAAAWRCAVPAVASQPASGTPRADAASGGGASPAPPGVAATSAPAGGNPSSPTTATPLAATVGSASVAATSTAAPAPPRLAAPSVIADAGPAAVAPPAAAPGNPPAPVFPLPPGAAGQAPAAAPPVSAQPGPFTTPPVPPPAVASPPAAPSPGGAAAAMPAAPGGTPALPGPESRPATRARALPRIGHFRIVSLAPCREAVCPAEITELEGGRSFPAEADIGPLHLADALAAFARKGQIELLVSGELLHGPRGPLLRALHLEGVTPHNAGRPVPVDRPSPPELPHHPPHGPWHRHAEPAPAPHVPSFLERLLHL